MRPTTSTNCIPIKVWAPSTETQPSYQRHRQATMRRNQKPPWLSSLFSRATINSVVTTSRRTLSLTRLAGVPSLVQCREAIPQFHSYKQRHNPLSKLSQKYSQSRILIQGLHRKARWKFYPRKAPNKRISQVRKHLPKAMSKAPTFALRMKKKIHDNRRPTTSAKRHHPTHHSTRRTKPMKMTASSTSDRHLSQTSARIFSKDLWMAVSRKERGERAVWIKQKFKKRNSRRAETCPMIRIS